VNILVLQPIRPSNPPTLRERADALLERMVSANPGMCFDICQDDSAVPVPKHPSLYMRHATVRNYMLDTYLRPEHTHVLWIDSDLIDYPADLPMRLASVWATGCTGAIVAPTVLLDDSPARLARLPGRERFYDIGGFIEQGRRARMYPPWFGQQGDVVELDSVGCCYLAPAQLYHEGARYQPPHTDYYVEHWSVMQEARRRGYRIFAMMAVRAVHAWLPDYGMDAN
jgi:hypothetical protein